MRKLYFTAAFLFIYFFSIAAPVISVVNNGGNWRIASTWNLNRHPQDGDPVVIPAGTMVVIDNNWNISPSNLLIKVNGTLKVAGSGSKPVIGSGSYVWVTSGQVSEEKVVSNPAGQLVLNTKMKGNSIISLSNGQDISLARQVIL